MKLLTLFATIAAVSAFAPAANVGQSSTALNAVQSRKAFFSAAGAAAFGAAVAPVLAMDQELVTSPTEQWETGSPTSAAESDRIARYANARTQLNSNFAPIKRLNLERKSPVTRLDINAPGFTAYKKTYPGLFREGEAPAVAAAE